MWITITIHPSSDPEFLFEKIFYFPRALSLGLFYMAIGGITANHENLKINFILTLTCTRNINIISVLFIRSKEEIL